MKPVDHPWREYGFQTLTIALACLPLLFIAYLYYFQFTYLTLDFFIDEHQRGLVMEIPPDSLAAQHGLEVGDRILTINGKPMGEGNLEESGNNLVLIERENRIKQLTIPSVNVLSMNIEATISATIASLAFWGVGLLLMLRRRHNAAVRLFFVLSQTVAISIFPPLVDPSPWKLPAWVISLSVSGLILIAPLLLHYLVTYPVFLGSASRRQKLLPFTYLIAWVVILAYLFQYPRALEISAAYTASIVAIALFLLVYAYLRRSTPEDKRRIRLLVAGNLIAALPPSFMYFLPRAYALPVWAPKWLVSMMIIASPISHLIATLKYNLFHIDRLLNRALVFFLISAVIFSLFSGTFFIIYRYLQGELFLQTLLLTAVVLVLGVGFNWLRTETQKIVDRAFYGGWYDYQGVVETISRELAKSLDRHTLKQVLCHQVGSLMHLHAAELYLEAQDMPTKDQPEPSCSFPLYFQGKLRGVWIPGIHLDGEALTESDLRILTTIAKQAELAFGNVLLVEELRMQLEEIRLSRASIAQAKQQQTRSREEERRILARELHDGPIQRLVGMNLQLGLLLKNWGEEHNPDASDSLNLSDVRLQIQSLTNELRQVCATLRPPMLDALGLSAALKALLKDWSRQSGVVVNHHLPMITSLTNIPPDVSLNIYRIVQECLSNISKHAQAKNVGVILSADDQGLSLQVVDDGSGFNVPTSHHVLTSNGHYGITGMFERAELIGADLVIDSAFNQGTCVTLSWRHL